MRSGCWPPHSCCCSHRRCSKACNRSHAELLWERRKARSLYLPSDRFNGDHDAAAAFSDCEHSCSGCAAGFAPSGAPTQARRCRSEYVLAAGHSIRAAAAGDGVQVALSRRWASRAVFSARDRNGARHAHPIGGMSFTVAFPPPAAREAGYVMPCRWHALSRQLASFPAPLAHRCESKAKPKRKCLSAPLPTPDWRSAAGT